MSGTDRFRYHSAPSRDIQYFPCLVLIDTGVLEVHRTMLSLILLRDSGILYRFQPFLHPFDVFQPVPDPVEVGLVPADRDHTDAGLCCDTGYVCNIKTAKGNSIEQHDLNLVFMPALRHHFNDFVRHVEAVDRNICLDHALKLFSTAEHGPDQLGRLVVELKCSIVYTENPDLWFHLTHVQDSGGQHYKKDFNRTALVMEEVANEFMDFLKEYGVIALAIGVVMGTATKDLVNAIVDDVIMPVVNIVIPGGNWETATTVVGPVTFKTGHLISALLDFAIIALIVYLFIKYVLRKEEVEKI